MESKGKKTTKKVSTKVSTVKTTNNDTKGKIVDTIKKKKSRNLRQSFGYALEGLGYAFKTVRNMRIHLLFTLLVTIGGMIFKISRTEYFVCLVFIALVISLELVNTAIEEAVDLASPDINILAKRAKDVAAGAVLFASVIAFVVGCAIFIPRIFGI